MAGVASARLGTFQPSSPFAQKIAKGTNGLSMSEGGDDASRWRALAADARRVAAEMTDPDAHRTMVFIAESYERLARFARIRKKSSP
jgi:hypothetical protein